MIFTLNEEIHLPSCLDALDWCDDVIVVDSFSMDRTEFICRGRGVRFFQNRFEGFGSQRNWALDNTQPRHPWILILDADERVTPELGQELKAIAEANPAGVEVIAVGVCFCSSEASDNSFCVCSFIVVCANCAFSSSRLI